jgi:hypothetical protein
MNVFKAVGHIDIKKDQDRTDSNENCLAICDGIGQFDGSGIAAKILMEHLLFSEYGVSSELTGLIEKARDTIISEKIIGGSTFIFGAIDNRENIKRVRLSYLGNGSIYHLHGDYAELPKSFNNINNFYRYSNLLIPHVNKDLELIKYVSHQSEAFNIIPSTIELSLTGINGDILFLFSDGICSLEDEIIVNDDKNRIWRNLSQIVAKIIDLFHKWLILNSKAFTEKKLISFIHDTLRELKEAKQIEDDASIGIIISEEAIKYYKVNYVKKSN